MLLLLSLSLAGDPAPDASQATVAVEQKALLHLAAAFESGVARCPLPAADLADAELTLAGFPIADGNLEPMSKVEIKSESTEGRFLLPARPEKTEVSATFPLRPRRPSTPPCVPSSGSA
jgi:hypothetical protein